MKPKAKRVTARNAGRPRNGKRPFKVSLTPLARTVAGDRGLGLGVGFSGYVESLIRKDNPVIFSQLMG